MLLPPDTDALVFLEVLALSELFGDTAVRKSATKVTKKNDLPAAMMTKKYAQNVFGVVYDTCCRRGYIKYHGLPSLLLPGTGALGILEVLAPGDFGGTFSKSATN